LPSPKEDPGTPPRKHLPGCSPLEKANPGVGCAMGWGYPKSSLARGERLENLRKALLVLPMTLNLKERAHTYILVGKPA